MNIDPNRWTMNSTSVNRGVRIRALSLVLILCLACAGVGFGFSAPAAAPSRRRRSSSTVQSTWTRLEASDAVDSGYGTDDEAIRLNKVFKATHSRRQADDLIASGRVTVNDVPELTAGRRVVPFRDIVRLDGYVVNGWEALNHVSAPPKGGREKKKKIRSSSASAIPYEYIKYWKPRGVTCTTDRSIRSNIIDAIQDDGYRPRNRVYPVGRLDRDTSGLILLTSDGRLPNSALRGQYKQPKTYEVFVDRPVSDDKVRALRDGVVITTQAQRDRRRPPPLTARTKPCVVERIGGGRRRLRMTLVEGRNRQIRKMIEAVGGNVVELHRTEFMRIRLAPLRGPGDWAPLSRDELGMVQDVIDRAEREEREAPR